MNSLSDNHPKLLLTWEEFDEAVLAAAQDLRSREFMRKCTGIYGIPRGGLILAVALSHHMDLPWLAQPKPGCLLVDDVIESGATMLRLLQITSIRGIADKDVAAWVWINKHPTLNTGYHRFVDPGTWVVFPWEDWGKANEERAKYVAAHTLPPPKVR